MRDNKTYHYYFENGTCRTFAGVMSVKVDTWIHLTREADIILVNPQKVNFVKIEDEK